jgi:hypothetical protein
VLRKPLIVLATTLTAGAIGIAVAGPATAATTHGPTPTTLGPAPNKPGTSGGTEHAQLAQRSTTPHVEFSKTPRRGITPRDASTYVGTNPGATGRCGFDVCLYWDGNEGGAAAGFYGSSDNLAGFTYPNNGAGAGQGVKNNAASIEDDGSGTDYSYYNENYSGQNDWLNSYTYGNLVQTWNNEASISSFA